MSLGGAAQEVAAFVMVQMALNWLVDNYPGLAECLWSVNRVGSLPVALPIDVTAILMLGGLVWWRYGVGKEFIPCDDRGAPGDEWRNCSLQKAKHPVKRPGEMPLRLCTFRSGDPGLRAVDFWVNSVNGGTCSAKACAQRRVMIVWRSRRRGTPEIQSQTTKSWEHHMSMIIWILLGLGMGLIASKIVSTTGEGTVVDALLGIVGAVLGGWVINLFGGTRVSGFDIGSVYSAVAAVIGAIILLGIYHVFFRRRML